MSLSAGGHAAGQGAGGCGECRMIAPESEHRPIWSALAGRGSGQHPPMVLGKKCPLRRRGRTTKDRNVCAPGTMGVEMQPSLPSHQVWLENPSTASCPALCSPGLQDPRPLSMNTVWARGDTGGGTPLHPKQTPPSLPSLLLPSHSSPLSPSHRSLRVFPASPHHHIHPPREEAGRCVRTGTRPGTAIKAF